MKYTETLQKQFTLRDTVTSIKAEIDFLEQLFTATLVTLATGAQFNALLQPIANELFKKRKEVEELVGLFCDG